jgi:serine/threonine-protein kinase
MDETTPSVLEQALKAKHALEEATIDPLLGVELHNLRIEELIGQGGFGAVYRAVHTRLDTPFAIKVLHAQIEEQPDLVARFEREAKASAMLHHPHIIRVSDFGQLEDGRYYLIMDFLRGKSLKESLADKEAFSTERILTIMDALCDALGYIHNQQMIHRDIKPSNIFLSLEPGQQKEHLILIDFGIAALVNDHSLTQPGTRLGTPTYMSPEQAKGQSDEVDGRCDLYAAGIILFQLLTGTPPFVASSHPEMLYKHIHEPPPSLKDIRPDVAWAPKLEAMLQTSLAKEPTERYPDAHAFFDALQDALNAQNATGPLPDPQTSPTNHVLSDEMASMPTQTIPDATYHPPNRAFPVLWVAVGAGLLVCLLVSLFWFR